VTDRLHTAREIAALLQVSERGVLRMALNGEIPAVRVRRVWRFDPEAVMEALSNRTEEMRSAR
jgi:excisionase family DNA binding protein